MSRARPGSSPASSTPDSQSSGEVRVIRRGRLRPSILSPGVWRGNSNAHAPHAVAAESERANWHAHLLITTSRLEGDQFAAKKARDLGPEVRRAGRLPVPVSTSRSTRPQLMRPPHIGLIPTHIAGSEIAKRRTPAAGCAATAAAQLSRKLDLSPYHNLIWEIDAMREPSRSRACEIEPRHGEQAGSEGKRLTIHAIGRRRC